MLIPSIPLLADPYAFLIYNLQKSNDSLGDVLQIHWTLLGSLFRGSVPSAWNQMKNLSKVNNFCSLLLNKIIYICVMLKICSKNDHISNINLGPRCANYNVSSIQIHLIWFYSLITFWTSVWKPKHINTHQSAITHDRKQVC